MQCNEYNQTAASLPQSSLRLHRSAGHRQVPRAQGHDIRHTVLQTTAHETTRSPVEDHGGPHCRRNPHSDEVVEFCRSRIPVTQSFR